MSCEIQPARHNHQPTNRTGLATKKKTQFDNGPGPGRNYGETAVFTFWLKSENGKSVKKNNNKKTSEIRETHFIMKNTSSPSPGPWDGQRESPPVASTWWKPYTGGKEFISRSQMKKWVMSVLSHKLPLFSSLFTIKGRIRRRKD